MSRKCCRRKNVSEFEYTPIPPGLSQQLRRAFWECKALGVDPEAEVLCGDCRQKLMGRHRQFGRKAIVSRASMAQHLTGQPLARNRARWQRDEV